MPQDEKAVIRKANKEKARVAEETRIEAERLRVVEEARLPEEESAHKSYVDYGKNECLQIMGDSFRDYNGSSASKEAILASLFPGLNPGEYPDLATATKKFSELAASNRPYAELFNPPKE